MEIDNANVNFKQTSNFQQIIWKMLQNTELKDLISFRPKILKKMKIEKFKKA